MSEHLNPASAAHDVAVDTAAPLRPSDPPTLRPSNLAPSHPDYVAAPPSDALAPVRPRARAPYRVPLVWLLSALSLLPGVVAAAARDFWGGLPDAFRFATYALAGVMILAAVTLIATHRE